MSTIAIRKDRWDALTATRRRAVEQSGPVRLGNPATYIDDTGVDWCVWDDDRIRPDHVEEAAARLVNRAKQPRRQPSADEKDYDPSAEAVKAQGAEVQMQAGAEVPSDWTVPDKKSEPANDEVSSVDAEVVAKPGK